MNARIPTAAEERAIDAHLERLWETLRVGRDAAIVHRGGDATRCLPPWSDLDEASQAVFALLTAPALRQMMHVADGIAAELDNPDGLER